MITPELLKKSEQLFLAAHALQVTWTEIVNLKEAIDSALTNELGGGRTFSTINCEGEGPEEADRDCWSYEFKFEGYRRRQNRKALLAFEFRLCWPPEYHIKRADGSEFKLPLIIVMGTSDPNQEFSCFDFLRRPDERKESVDYEVHDRLLWASSRNYWYFVFAVPLLSIVDKECVKNELVLPCSTIVNANAIDADADPAALEKLAFASSNNTLSWIEDTNKDVVLAQPGS
jgi:hypothetical protein